MSTLSRYKLPIFITLARKPPLERNDCNIRPYPVNHTVIIFFSGHDGDEEQFPKIFDSSNISTPLFSEVNEVGVVEPDNKNEISIKQEIDHDDLNSIETLSASECEDEEDALPERESYEVINTGSSGGKFFRIL